MKSYIWDSSVFRTRTPQVQSQKPGKYLANHSIRNISTSKSKGNRSDSPQHPESFQFPRARLSNFPSKVDTDVSNPLNEDLKFIQTTEESLEKPSIDRFEEGMKEYKSLFVVHTYARPRRLVSVKEKHSVKDLSNESKKLLSSPTIRLGISGWKLSKPRSVTPNNMTSKSLKRKNNFLQIISTKL